MKIKFSSERDFNILNKYLDTYKLSTVQSCLSQNVSSSLSQVRLKKNYILHIGVGNFHRSHQAFAVQQINKLHSSEDWNIIGIGLRDADRNLRDCLRRQFFQYTLVSRCNQKSLIEIIDVLKEIFIIPDMSKNKHFINYLPFQDIQIISITITEKGYTLDAENNLNEEDPLVQSDFQNWKRESGIGKPKTAVGLLCTFLFHRMVKDQPPITVMSSDNLYGNGTLTKRICLQFSMKVNEKLSEYIEKNIAFPNSMVDRITPMTTKTDRFALQLNYNIIDHVPVVCENFIAWAIENKFSSPRPKFELFSPITLTSNIYPYESQKLVLLNSSHSFIAYIGLFFSKKYVYEYMLDDFMVRLLKNYIDEVMITLPEDDENLNHNEYKEDLLIRFENYFVKDELTRIAQDGTQKLKVCLEIPLSYYYQHNGNQGCPKHICIMLALLLLFLKNCKEKNCDPLQEKIKNVIMGGFNRENISNVLQMFLPAKFHTWEELFEQVTKYTNDIFYNIPLQEILAY